MSGLPPIDLSDSFRSSGLGSVLAARETVTTPAAPAPAPAGSQPTPAGPQRPGRARGVIVYLTVGQRDWVRAHSRHPDRTVTDVVLDAIEAHLDALGPAATEDTGAQGLFARRPQPAAASGGGVQVHLRLTPDNIATLDGLVAEHGYPSRSSMIRAALGAAGAQ